MFARAAFRWIGEPVGRGGALVLMSVVLGNGLVGGEIGHDAQPFACCPVKPNRTSFYRICPSVMVEWGYVEQSRALSAVARVSGDNRRSTAACGAQANALRSELLIWSGGRVRCRMPAWRNHRRSDFTFHQLADTGRLGSFRWAAKVSHDRVDGRVTIDQG